MFNAECEKSTVHVLGRTIGSTTICWQCPTTCTSRNAVYLRFGRKETFNLNKCLFIWCTWISGRVMGSRDGDPCAWDPVIEKRLLARTFTRGQLHWRFPNDVVALGWQLSLTISMKLDFGLQFTNTIGLHLTSRVVNSYWTFLTLSLLLIKIENTLDANQRSIVIEGVIDYFADSISSSIQIYESQTFV